MAPLLERRALPMRFGIQLVQDFQKKYHVSRHSILRHCFDVMSLGKALNPHLVHLTQVKTKDRNVNVYDKLNASKLLQDCYALRGLNEQVNVYYFRHTI